MITTSRHSLHNFTNCWFDSSEDCLLEKRCAEWLAFFTAENDECSHIVLLALTLVAEDRMKVVSADVLDANEGVDGVRQPINFSCSGGWCSDRSTVAERSKDQTVAVSVPTKNTFRVFVFQCIC